MREKWSLLGLFVAIACAGCGGSSTGAHSTSQESSTGSVTASPSAKSAKQIASVSKPTKCLDAAGLSDVRAQQAGVWSGRHDAPAYVIVVHRLGKPARTPRVVAGEYAVTGSFKIVAVGRGFIGDEGIQADALVQIVADCLGS